MVGLMRWLVWLASTVSCGPVERGVMVGAIFTSVGAIVGVAVVDTAVLVTAVRTAAAALLVFSPICKMISTR